MLFVSLSFSLSIPLSLIFSVSLQLFLASHFVPPLLYVPFLLLHSLSFPLSASGCCKWQSDWFLHLHAHRQPRYTHADMHARTLNTNITVVAGQNIFVSCHNINLSDAPTCCCYPGHRPRLRVHSGHWIHHRVTYTFGFSSTSLLLILTAALWELLDGEVEPNEAALFCLQSYLLGGHDL